MNVDPYGFPDPAGAAAPPGGPRNAARTRWATIVAVPLVTLIFSLAYYLARSNDYFLGLDAGIDPSSLSRLGTFGAIAGLVAGVGLGAAVGGASALTAGLILFVVGAGIQASGAIEAGVVVVAIGRYMFNVGAGATLARGPRREGTRVAMYMLVYVAVNLGALGARPLGWITDAFGPVTALGAAAAIAVLALAPTVPVLLLHLLRPPESAEQLAAGLAPRTLLGAGIAAIVVLVAYTAWSWGINLQWQVAANTGAASAFLFQALNPVVVIASGAMFAAVIGGLGLAGFQVPALAVAGVGALVLGGGLLPSVFADMVHTAAPAYLAQVLSGVGEPLFFAGIQARIVAGVHWRIAPIGAAVLPMCGLLASGLGHLSERGDLTGSLATGAGVVVLVGGVALCVGALLDRRAAGVPTAPA